MKTIISRQKNHFLFDDKRIVMSNRAKGWDVSFNHHYRRLLTYRPEENNKRDDSLSKMNIQMSERTAEQTYRKGAVKVKMN